MAVIGSRANGTRVPDDALKGGGFGAAHSDSATAATSDRRHVTFLGRPAFGPAGSGIPARSGAPEAAPLDPRSSLFVASTLDRVRREWLDRLDESETALDPQAASGFAGGIARQFDDFSAKTLADMPEALQPHLKNGLSRVGDELGVRARDFETLATRVGVFNQAKQALDDLTDTVRHDRLDVPRIIAEGRARIAEAPVSTGGRKILEEYFLADLPLKVAQAHIDDDPEDAFAAIQQASREKRGSAVRDGSTGVGRRENGASPDEAAVEPLEGTSPAELYRTLAPEVRGRFATQAQIKASSRRQAERLGTIGRLQQGIAANRITAADIAASGVDDSDQAQLIAMLESAEADERRTAEAVKRFVSEPESFDPEDPQDRTQADRAYQAIAGELISATSLLGVPSEEDGDAIDVIGLADDFAFRSRFLPDIAVDQLRHIERKGSPQDRERAAALLDEFGVDPVADPAAAPEQTSTADPNLVGKKGDPAGSLRDDGRDSDGVNQTVSDEERTAFGVVLEVVDIVTDFVPVVSEVKAVVEAIELSSRLTEAHERGDEAAVRELSAQLALTMTDLLPGPNIAGAVRRIGRRSDGIPLIQTLKQKLQRLLSKSKDEDNPDVDTRSADASIDTRGARKGEPDDGQKDNETPDDEESVGNRFPDWEIPSDVLAKIPEAWGPGIPNRKAKKRPAKAGLRWFDPDEDQNGVRIDRGNPDSRYPSQQVDHVIVNFGGRIIGRDGNPIKGSIRDNYNDAHIPLSEYRTWKHWFKP